MPDNYEVEIGAINVPGRSLVPGVNVGVQDTLEPGSSYTVDATITMQSVPPAFTADHCGIVRGGAEITMEAINTDGSVTDTQCVTGPAGDTTGFSVELEAPTSRSVEDTIEVRFYGAESGEIIGESTFFQIETAATGGGGSGGDTTAYEVEIGGINVPGRSLVPGVNVGVQGVVEPDSTYTVESTISTVDVPGVAHPDHCDVVGGGVEVRMEAESDVAGTLTDTKCVSGGSSETFSVDLPTAQQSEYVDTVYVDFYGAGSGTRLVDTTVFEVETSGTQGVPDFDLDTVKSDCTISQSRIEEGESVEVDVDLEGYSPNRNTYEVGIRLLVNGASVARGSGNVTANGSNGASFVLENLPPGENNIGYELLEMGVK